MELEEKCFDVCFAGAYLANRAFWDLNSCKNIEPVWLPYSDLSSFHVSIFGKTAEKIFQRIVRKHRGAIR